MLEVGQNIDRFTIQSVLGQGGMAIVYRVSHHQLQSEHALKVLTVGSKAITERMLQEGRVQASLRHPNVVAVHDVLDVGGQPGLLMEYIDGPALDEFLAKHPRPDTATALRIFEGTCQGVHHAHQQGLIHRDLKPGNILLQRSGRHWIPKVTDFGLAKLVEGDANLSKTRSGVAMGTPSYMSPEQIRDAKSVDHRGDVFALAAILYELFTGEQAFPGENILEIFNKVADGTYVDPVELNPAIPATVLEAIRGGLQVEAADRIPDVQTLLDVAIGDLEFASISQGGGGERPQRVNETLAPLHSFDDVERDATVVRAPASDATVIDPRQANATILQPTRSNRLTELGISQTTLEPVVVQHGNSLVVVLGAMVVTALAIGLGVFFGIQALAPSAPVPEVVSVEPSEPAPTVPEPAEPEPSEPVQVVAPKPVAPAPVATVAPVVVPEPTVVAPAAPKKPSLAIGWQGVLGSKPMKLAIDSQRGVTFEGTATLGGHPMAVAGTVGQGEVRFTEVGGSGVFTGSIRDDGRWQGRFMRQAGAAEEQWFLQPR